MFSQQLMFQFPSNGKAYLNWNTHPMDLIGVIVSIPFKRESISEQGLGNEYIKVVVNGFNSLQTGKHI